MTRLDIDRWFVDEVLPLEGMLERFIRRNWRDDDDVAEMRQEVYARVFVACADFRPQSAQAFVLATAKNLLIDRARRARIVSIETFADMDALTQATEVPTERHVIARSELRHLQTALGTLPRRCREVIELRKIEGLSQQEVAVKMGISEDTVERQVSKGVRALAIAFANTGSGARKVAVDSAPDTKVTLQ